MAGKTTSDAIDVDVDISELSTVSSLSPAPEEKETKKQPTSSSSKISKTSKTATTKSTTATANKMNAGNNSARSTKITPKTTSSGTGTASNKNGTGKSSSSSGPSDILNPKKKKATISLGGATRMKAPAEAGKTEVKKGKPATTAAKGKAAGTAKGKVTKKVREDLEEIKKVLPNRDGSGDKVSIWQEHMYKPGEDEVTYDPEEEMGKK